MKIIWKILNILCIVALLMNTFPTPIAAAVSINSVIDLSSINTTITGTFLYTSTQLSGKLVYKETATNPENNIVALGYAQTQFRAQKKDLYVAIIQLANKQDGSGILLSRSCPECLVEQRELANAEADLIYYKNLLKKAVDAILKIEDTIDTTLGKLATLTAALAACAKNKICIAIVKRAIQATEFILTRVLPVLLAAAIGVMAGLLINVAWAEGKVLLKKHNLADCLKKTKLCGGSCYVPGDCLSCCNANCVANVTCNLTSTPSSTPITPTSTSPSTSIPPTDTPPPTDSSSEGDGNVPTIGPPTPPRTPGTPTAPSTSTAPGKSATPGTPTAPVPSITPGKSATPSTSTAPVPSMTPGKSATPSTSTALVPPMTPSPGSITVSSNGGEFPFGENVTVNIPPKAVSVSVDIVYIPKPVLPVTGFVTVESFTLEAYFYTDSQWQKFTNFKKPVTIQVSYTPEQVVGMDESQLGLYNFNNALNQWVELPGKVNTEANTVTAELQYFGLNGYLYALMLPAASVQPKVPNDIVNLSILAGVALAAFVVLWAGLRWRQKIIRPTSDPKQ